MNRKPLVWLLLALIFVFYAAYLFLSNTNGSLWSTVSGIICIVAAIVVFWKYLVEQKADRSE
ncbi:MULTISPECIES: hypothetical protein [unclassified Arthrobacter]|uniref:hypothetical protein n=1 Tax=unclassified Arthrobacter TaxID=235627 RepID=UPI0025515E48|nr:MULTISPECIES: hypothetical protein [unclassified Arthrobacter]